MISLFSGVFVDVVVVDLKLPNVLLTTSKKWTKVKNAREGRAKLLFLSIKYENL